jgi:hypothetical protein
MEREFLPYELAFELKQLGFNHPCICIYSSPNIKELKNVMQIYKNSELSLETSCTAHMYQQAFRFFREKYKIRFFIQSGMSDLGEFFKIIFPDGESRSFSYATYELAEIECLNTLIEIVKSK